MKLDTLVSHLDELLRCKEIPDISDNGLQVEGGQEVEHVGSAVDASAHVIGKAIETGCQFLIVHHGLFWGKAERVVGPHRARMVALLESNLSVYAAHLPLDLHPDLGNNALLLRILGMECESGFGSSGGMDIGFRGRFETPRERGDLVDTLGRELGGRVDIYPFGPERIRTMGVVSGSGGSFVAEAVELGLDALLVGEWTYASYHLAKDHGLNVLAAGHYATETVGVRALGDHLSEQWGLEHTFLPEPIEK